MSTACVDIEIQTYFSGLSLPKGGLGCVVGVLVFCLVVIVVCMCAGCEWSHSFKNEAKRQCFRQRTDLGSAVGGMMFTLVSILS
jgi:hypothetical protein